jgi:hypothetical protein
MDPLPDLPVIIAFQQLNDYITCPKRFYHRYIANDCPKEQKSFQQSGGIATHDAIKRRLKLREPLPPDLAACESTCARILAEDAQRDVELGLGCTLTGGACDFFDPACRLRTRIDLSLTRGLHAVIIDWKTGKPWEDPLELSVQGLLLKIHHPELKNISAFYWWLRTNHNGPIYQIDPDKTWDNVRMKMGSIRYRIDNNDWPADDGPLCAWCPVGKEQCKFKRDPK